MTQRTATSDWTLTPEQSQLAADHFYLVETIALEFSGVYPRMRDELESSAQHGLCRAARTWDPSRNPNFKAWAIFKMRFEIIGDARAPFRRLHRAKVKVLSIHGILSKSKSEDSETTGEPAGDFVGFAEVDLCDSARKIARLVGDSLSPAEFDAILSGRTQREVGAITGVAPSMACLRAQGARSTLARVASFRGEGIAALL